MRIAFYAPMKPPSHPVPSGDREMARLLMTALEAGGHRVALVSTLRSYVPEPRPDLMNRAEAALAVEAETIAAGWRQGGGPDLWFTYHSYYKAPDLLGPCLAQRFAIPYATAEASHAPKRGHGPWRRWNDANEAAIRFGAVHFCFTPADRAGLEQVINPAARIVDLPPFIGTELFRGNGTAMAREGPVELVTVAMMRPGAKSRSYRFLAEALARLPGAAHWRLTIAGDGPARGEVKGAMAALPADRIVFRGELSRAEIASALRQGDVFVWPGYDEAYGMCYLEAGAAGLPVLAMRTGGIPSVVLDNETGILTPEGDLDSYAAALLRLIEDRTLRNRLGGVARRWVLTERNVVRAAGILSDGLARALRNTATLKQATV